ncbi:MAG TPA: D-glycero-beta-D-manno-heptose 1-phosphate adenylyltransferase [Gemmatimonadales bacterium]|nr:D-glycero-beta-D-manno-heptose 1-phosphate adenylyltransferase [Gemmatimonadales bacterium]
MTAADPGAPRTASKVRSLADAVAWRRRQIGPVVFTNGVFDLVHPGHVELLEAARAEGAALVVGVNSDASVRRLGKGPERPLVPERARARVLAGFAAVDCVVLFDEDTPLELIRALEPDVLVKGADYTRDRIVGADEVERRGGRVVRVPLVTGMSTTAIVEKLRASS